MMKNRILFSFLLLFLILPSFSFSAVSIGIRIPIRIGEHGPIIYVQGRAYPAGTWEDVLLQGTVVSATSDYIAVRTPEGFSHDVYITQETISQGDIFYNAAVSVRARLVHGALYAYQIVAASPAALPGPYPNSVQSSPPAPVYYYYPQPYPYSPPVYYYPQTYYYGHPYCSRDNPFGIYFRFGGEREHHHRR